jgi:integrase
VSRKRGNGEGSITKRKDDGRWMARYTVHTAAGRERKTIYGKTRAEVAEKLAKAVMDRAGGLVFDAGTLRLLEYLERWLADSVRGTVRATTYENYSYLVRTYTVPSLGCVKLKALTPAHVQRFYREKLDSGLAPRTVQYLHTLLRKALKQAVKWGMVPRNVTDAVDAPRPAKKETKYFSFEAGQGLPEGRLRGPVLGFVRAGHLDGVAPRGTAGIEVGRPGLRAGGVASASLAHSGHQELQPAEVGKGAP